MSTAESEHQGVSETAIGWLAQVFPLPFIVLAIPAGALLDRWSAAACSPVPSSPRWALWCASPAMTSPGSWPVLAP